MGREPRVYEPGAIYHLTAHGVDDRPIFRDDGDRQSFVMRLIRIVGSCRWRLYAACLLDTHYHLVISTEDARVASGMRVLNGGHSRAFNAKYQRRGALFEARYRDQRVRNDSHLLEVIRYVALNPVRAGMVARPEQWPWSTYPQLIGLTAPWPCFAPRMVRAHFAAAEMRAIERITDLTATRV